MRNIDSHCMEYRLSLHGISTLDLCQWGMKHSAVSRTLPTNSIITGMNNILHTSTGQDRQFTDIILPTIHMSQTMVESQATAKTLATERKGRKRKIQTKCQLLPINKNNLCRRAVHPARNDTTRPTAQESLKKTCVRLAQHRTRR